MSERVPRADVGLGCVKLGSAAAGGPNAGTRLVHAAVDRGIAFFDTADAYGAGASERVLGRALRGGHRDGVAIATKGGYVFAERSRAALLARRAAAPLLGRSVGRRTGREATAPAARTYGARDFSPAHLRRAVEGSLRRLATDRIDLYQLHGPPTVCADDTIAALQQLRADGKILAFGAGLEAIDGAAAWLDVAGVSSLQVPFGVLDPEASATLLPAAARRGVGIVARGVFAAGLLADTDPLAEEVLRAPQRALRRAVRAAAVAHGLDPLAVAAAYVRYSPGVSTVLLGMSSVSHLDENLRHVDAPPLPPTLVGAIDDAHAAYAAAARAGQPGDAA